MSTVPTLQNPIVSYSATTYIFTVESLAPNTTTWSYSTTYGSEWSDDYTLLEKSTLQLAYGTYYANTILFRNKNSDGITSPSPLVGNSGTQIVVRPGYPSVNFEGTTGIIRVLSLGVGAVLWRYSIDSGSSWSADIVGVGTARIPPGTYPPGYVCVMNYTADYTASIWPRVNTSFMYVGVIHSGIISSAVEPPENMVQFPTDGATNIIVTLVEPYIAWEYSIGVDPVANIRIWINSPSNSNIVQITPGYYPVYALGIRLIHKNGTYVNVFNRRESAIYPDAPSVAYIEKGLIVVKHTPYTTTWQYNIGDNIGWRLGINSVIRLPVGNYPIGYVKVRNVINDVITSPSVWNTEEIIVSDTYYDENGLNSTWLTSTVLTKPANKGNHRLEVLSTHGFKVSHIIIIGYGEKSEIKTVSGFGSLVVNIALANSYPEGTLIRGFDYIEGPLISEELAAFFYENMRSISNRKRGRVNCLNYIFEPEKATIDSCVSGNETKWLFGDKSFASADSKINRLVSKVNHLKRGKIVYGEHGLSSPFLPPDTIEETAVSQYYRCNRPNDTPIINGLRGGIVPVKMRTNKF